MTVVKTQRIANPLKILKVESFLIILKGTIISNKISKIVF